MHEYPFLLKSVVKLLLLFLVVAALLIARQLLVPLFLSVMIAYLLYPAANWLENHKVPRILANLIVILGFLAVLGGLSVGVCALVSNLSDSLPDVKDQFEKNFKRIQDTIGSYIGIGGMDMETALQQLGQTGEYVKGLFSATANTILAIGLLPVYTFLLLFYRNKFKEFVLMKVEPDQEENVHRIIKQAAEVVPKYLKGLVIVCVILAVLNSLGFFIIGVKHALLMGIIAALFNLIPYLGTVIGYGIVFLFALGVQGPSVAFAVLIQFFIIQFTENNILTPNITGSYVQINPLVTIFSLIAGGMIWGLPGMLIVIPYLGLFKIVCENIKSLEPLGFLLGTRGTERYSITIKSIQEKFGWSNNE